MKNMGSDEDVLSWLLNEGSTELIENGIQGRGKSREFCPYPYV